MPKILHRPVPVIEHLKNDVLINRLSWDDLRIFLVCVQFGSFRKAAAELHISSSTIVRRIDRLENALSVRLFNRVPHGVSLTIEGQAIVDRVEDMERTVCEVVRLREQDVDSLHGSVSISVTEGLGSYWVMPQLVRFQRSNPMFMINMRCAMENADVLRLEADMAVQFDRPESPDLIIRRLGKLHIYPFASQEYIEIYGMPRSREDMANHRLIQQVAPQIDESVWADLLGIEQIEDIVGIRTNASTAILYAVENGAGIGALPTYVYALNKNIVPIDIGIQHEFDIWLTYHPDVKKSPSQAIAINWLTSIFDPAAYPWFREEFIHPKKFGDEGSIDLGANSGRRFFADDAADI